MGPLPRNPPPAARVINAARSHGRVVDHNFRVFLLVLVSLGILGCVVCTHGLRKIFKEVGFSTRVSA